MAKMNTDIDKVFNILSTMSYDKKARARVITGKKTGNTSRKNK